MLRADREALPILVSLALGITEAILRHEPIALPPQVSDVLIEWLETDQAQKHAAVRELIADLNSKQV